MQQAGSPVPCSAGKLVSQPGSLHPGRSACDYTPLKREEEKEMLRPFSSEITNPHHHYLAGI